MSGKGIGPAIGIDLSTTKSCVGEIIPNDQGNRTTPSNDSEQLVDDAAMNPVNTDAKKQEDDDEEAKQLLVDMIVNETIRNTSFMEELRETKVDAGKNAWDEKRKEEKEELKKKREELKKKREEKQNNKQDKAMGKKKM
ncbi:Heat shock 70 kDa protein 1 [Cardamine amara subsp. amara]|uniref:Heat shock 70 kDa protein 1 n=1 Tax=Cardamine amara subsp. amara TaxID=228776 RepID=A0ABD0ZDJ5_CARAN